MSSSDRWTALRWAEVMGRFTSWNEANSRAIQPRAREMLERRKGGLNYCLRQNQGRGDLGCKDLLRAAWEVEESGTGRRRWRSPHPSLAPSAASRVLRGGLRG